MITDETRWFFNDNQCTKVGDAYNNKPVRRWTTHFRGDTANMGPVHWISENYVCPNCVQDTDHRCCQNVPQGLFCTPDGPASISTALDCESESGVSLGC